MLDVVQSLLVPTGVPARVLTHLGVLGVLESLYLHLYVDSAILF